MGTAHAGHCISSPLLSHWAAAVPQCGQNFMPRNIIPKQHGQEIAARRAPQWAQTGDSLATAAPQLWQCKVWAFIGSSNSRKAHPKQRLLWPRGNRVHARGDSPRRPGEALQPDHPALGAWSMRGKKSRRS
jgi:hypothetical protein